MVTSSETPASLEPEGLALMHTKHPEIQRRVRENFQLTVDDSSSHGVLKLRQVSDEKEPRQLLTETKALRRV